MVLTSPIWGHGLGSLSQEYSQLKLGDGDARLDSFDNPHNQFLLTLFELGILGFSVLMYMFLKHGTMLKNNTHKDEAYLAELTEGLVLTILIGSLFNSLLLDASEGKFYCVMVGLLLSAYVPRPKTNA
jgi:O-antigen ligase